MFSPEWWSNELKLSHGWDLMGFSFSFFFWTWSSLTGSDSIWYLSSSRAFFFWPRYVEVNLGFIRKVLTSWGPISKALVLFGVYLFFLSILGCSGLHLALKSLIFSTIDILGYPRLNLFPSAEFLISLFNFFWLFSKNWWYLARVSNSSFSLASGVL
jgi:hypothetical protein